MNVKTLIKKLQKMDPELEVFSTDVKHYRIIKLRDVRGAFVLPNEEREVSYWSIADGSEDCEDVEKVVLIELQKDK